MFKIINLLIVQLTQVKLAKRCMTTHNLMKIIIIIITNNFKILLIIIMISIYNNKQTSNFIIVKIIIKLKRIFQKLII